MQHHRPLALPWRHIPDHHGGIVIDTFADNNCDAHEPPGDYVLVRRVDLDDLRARLEIDDDLKPTAFWGAAYNVVAGALFDDDRVTITLDTAADPTRNRRESDDDGDLWRLLAGFLGAAPSFERSPLCKAIAARYGPR